MALTHQPPPSPRHVQVDRNSKGNVKRQIAIVTPDRTHHCASHSREDAQEWVEVRRIAWFCA